MKLGVDDRVKATRRRARETGQASSRGLPDSPQHHLIHLQRQVGNAAVARLLQRAPRERPAPTDAPWVKNRSRKPKPPKKKVSDIRARVVKFDIHQGKNMITIASGTEQGIQVGMTGALVQSDGRELDDFKIEKADGGSSTAYVKETQDQVKANPWVVIKASTFEPESQEGKEF